ncbi:PREDICTED: intercellular adhesion molecule 1 [Chrysochloris asiatica]|uniref:Intercellular adhesion molecule 1 n=1 Tax=Chrysochloris asiatica TaxID=185453 RepID=A0A9B0WYU6_CHRAS|nr:PREDICTED: intercellular adhesion molecule 1 [Chrysochloris asiatica]
MAPRGAWTLLAALPVLLGTVLPGCGGATTSVDPPKATLLHGGSLRVNCSTTCDQPSDVGLETALKKVEVARGTNWKIFELSDVQEDSKPICFTNCDNKQTMSSMSLTVYRFPELVELAPLPFWQPVGENFTLSCQVKGGAPRDSLKVVLLRGEEELGRQPVVGEPAEVPFTMSMPARREDHGANFSCLTELDLRSQGVALFKNSSTSRQLQTFVLPETDPLLTAPQIFEVGQNTTVSCSLKGVFPAREAQVYLTLGDTPLSPVMVSNAAPESVMATAVANKYEEGVQTLKCVVIVGNQSCDSWKTVTVYNFPDPNLTLSNLEVSESTEVNVVCQAHDAAVVTLTGVPVPTSTPIRSSNWKVHFQFNASAEDNGRSFTCSAVLEVDGQVIYKKQTQELRVLYGPRLNEEDCPGNWTWTEGSEQTLKCQAWGNPRPKLNCHRKEDAFSLPIGDLRPVKREHSGIYLCQAVSTQGKVTRQVVVNVLYKDNLLAIIITVTVGIILCAAVLTAWFYNRQRKIRKYKLQKAQEAASMKMNMPPSPP